MIKQSEPRAGILFPKEFMFQVKLHCAKKRVTIRDWALKVLAEALKKGK